MGSVPSCCQPDQRGAHEQGGDDAPAHDWLDSLRPTRHRKAVVRIGATRPDRIAMAVRSTRADLQGQRSPARDRRLLAGLRHGTGWRIGGWVVGLVAAPAVAAAPRLLRRNLWEVEVETWEAIRSRRNVRSYRRQAIAQDLDRI